MYIHSSTVLQPVTVIFTPHTQAPSNGLHYYPTPTTRPRSHSTGSPVPSLKRTTVKIVLGGKAYTKPRAFEDPRKQTMPPSQGSTSRYKTELCRPYQEYRVCKYGDKCQFAHGIHDLRILPRHPKYKTELCRTYHSTGFCPYGPRCHFIHNLDETRQPDSGDTPPCSPMKKTATVFSTSLPPISPSVDSGISSPDGFPGSSRSFEFPSFGSAPGVGPDEGSDDCFTPAPPFTRTTYSAYSPLSEDFANLEGSESGIGLDYSAASSPHTEYDTTSSHGSCSPLKSVGGGGTNGFHVPSDPALDLQNLLMGLGIKENHSLPPPSPRLSPPTPGGSLGSAARGRLPVFDNMINSQSDPGPGRMASFPTFP